MKGTFITQRVSQCFGRTQDFPGRFLHSSGPRVHISIVTGRGFQRRKTLILLLSPAGAHFFKGARPLLQPNSSKMGHQWKKMVPTATSRFSGCATGVCRTSTKNDSPKSIDGVIPLEFLNRVGQDLCFRIGCCRVGIRGLPKWHAFHVGIMGISGFLALQSFQLKGWTGKIVRNCWWFRNPANQLRLVVYLIIYRVYTFQVGFLAEFLKHQQKHCPEVRTSWVGKVDECVFKRNLFYPPWSLRYSKSPWKISHFSLSWWFFRVELFQFHGVAEGWCQPSRYHVGVLELLRLRPATCVLRWDFYGWCWIS